MTSLSAEYLYIAGRQWSSNPEDAVARLELAGRLFPFDHRFRNALAYTLFEVRWKGSRPLALQAVTAALEYDPFAFDLRLARAGLLFEAGMQEAAEREVMIVRHFRPNDPMQIVVNQNPQTN